MGVRTEEHILLECALVTPIKKKYGQEVVCFQTFMKEKKTKAQLHMIFEILELFEN